jgi:hypothetical protein
MKLLQSCWSMSPNHESVVEAVGDSAVDVDNYLVA